MWKIITVTALLYFGYRSLSKYIRKYTPSVYPSQSSSSLREGEMVRDPICNTYIVKTMSYSVQGIDTTHYFCSTECKDSFLKNQ